MMCAASPIGPAGDRGDRPAPERLQRGREDVGEEQHLRTIASVGSSIRLSGTSSHASTPAPRADSGATRLRLVGNYVLVRGICAPGVPAENEDVDALSAAVSGMQTASSWLNGAAQNIAASGGAPDPVDAVTAYVDAPLAYAANARVVDAAVSTSRSLFDAFA